MDKFFKQGDKTNIREKLATMNFGSNRQNININNITRTTSFSNPTVRDYPGRWVRLSVSATRRGTTNTFDISCSFWSSSTSVWNNFGQRIHFTGANIQGLPSTVTTYINGGSWGVKEKQFAVTITASTTLTVSTICAWCEDGLVSADHPYDYERTNFSNSESVSLSYIEQSIIPNTPAIVIQQADDSLSRAEYTDIYVNNFGISGNYRCYPAQTAMGNGQGNRLQFYIGKPGRASHTRIILEKYTPSTGWKGEIDTGWQSDLYHKYRYTFYSNNRIDKSVAWRVKAVAKSTTNHEAASGYTYFIINDQPMFQSDPNLRASAAAVTYNGTVNISWNRCPNEIFETSYRLRYKATTDNSWRETVVNNATNTNVTLSNYSRGTTVEFSILPFDKYDADTEYRGRVTVKINEIPQYEGGNIPSDKDGEPYKKRYANNVIFTLRNFVGGNGNKYYFVEYKVGDGGWNSYSGNYYPGNLSINCANYQNTRGGKLQLRARGYDGIDYGEYIYSNVLYKNILPVANVNKISTDRDNLPINNKYVNNVNFNLPGISDSDGHSTNYQIEYKIDNGGWNNYSNNHAPGNLQLNCSNYQNNPGGTFQLRARPQDCLEFGEFIYSNTLVRNVPPSQPVIYVDYGKKYLSDVDDTPHNGHVEKIYQIKWNNMNNYCDGSKIANSSFNVKFLNESNGLLKSVQGKDIENMGGIDYNKENHYLNDIIRNSTFKVMIEVTDLLGESNNTVIGPFIRNNTPTQPGNFEIDYPEIGLTTTKLRVIFNKSTDIENDMLYYHLQVKRYKQTEWTDIKNNYQNSSDNISWDITDNKLSFGDTYRIRCIDEHEAASDWTTLIGDSSTVCVPKITNPINPNYVYNKKPRFLFTLPGTNNKFVNIEITVGSKKYNNVDNLEYFSMPIYHEGDNGVFRCPSELKDSNLISIRAFVGDIFGKNSQVSTQVQECLESKIEVNTKLQLSRINNIQKMINKYYEAYGCDFELKEMRDLTEPTISTVEIYNNMIFNLTSINKYINDFDSKTLNTDILVDLQLENVNNEIKHLIKQINDIIDSLTIRI